MFYILTDMLRLHPSNLTIASHLEEELNDETNQEALDMKFKFAPQVPISLASKPTEKQVLSQKPTTIVQTPGYVENIPQVHTAQEVVGGYVDDLPPASDKEEKPNSPWSKRLQHAPTSAPVPQQVKPITTQQKPQTQQRQQPKAPEKNSAPSGR